MTQLTGQVNLTVPSGKASGQPPLYQDMMGASGVAEILGRYANLVKSGRVFSAYALVTSVVGFATAAGTGGPLLWNGTSALDAHILGVGIGGVTTANTVATTLGITGNTGQTAAPTTTTAIDASGNCLIGGAAPGMNVYRIGTVTNAGNRFIPLAGYGTGAITVDTTVLGWMDVGGLVIVQPNCWASLAAGVTATTGVINLGLIWAELPT